MEIFLIIIGIVLVIILIVINRSNRKKKQTKNVVPLDTNLESETEITDYNILHPDARNLLEQNILPNESIEVIIPGGENGALIATNRRIFIYKRGAISGAPFGSKLTSWDYKNLVGVQLETGFGSGFVALQGAGIQSVDLSFLGNNGNDALSSPHAILLRQRDYDLARERVPKVRQLISDFQQSDHSTSTYSINDLEKLADLKNKGIITDDEFNAKKKQILGL